uniref:Taste receptor type 2 n=1 Tax=Gouania willdenowi TaxID=441366 RepID=A0A8C5I0W7_GOUWI
MMVSSFSTAHYLGKHIRNFSKSRGSSSFTFYKPMMDVIDMGEQAFKGISFPLFFFNITANIFYALSLFLDRGKLKQPLNVLLGYMVLCTIIYFTTLIMMDTSDYLQSDAGFILVYTNSSMTCYVLLNFYYYVNIVPVKQALMVWAKKNIKSVIYVALIGETMLYLVNGVLKWTVFTLCFDGTNNQTGTGCRNEIHDLKEAFTIIIQVYIFLYVLIMMVSSFSTAHYLGKHIRNLAKSTSRLTSPNIQSQIRVTIAGVLQGLLYLFYYIFYLTNLFFFSLRTNIVFSQRDFITATTLFFSVTTVNIGISQTVIRQRAADVLRGLKALCGVNMETHDVSVHTSPVT